MEHFVRRAAQGEITLIRLGDLPPKKDDEYYDFGGSFHRMELEDGLLIIGHSETGHHHVMEPKSVTAAIQKNAPAGMGILRLIVESPTPIVHLRGTDTHEPIMVEPGVYEARLARQFDPFREIAIKVAD